MASNLAREAAWDGVATAPALSAQFAGLNVHFHGYLLFKAPSGPGHTPYFAVLFPTCFRLYDDHGPEKEPARPFLEMQRSNLCAEPCLEGRGLKGSATAFRLMKEAERQVLSVWASSPDARNMWVSLLRQSAAGPAQGPTVLDEHAARLWPQWFFGDALALSGYLRVREGTEGKWSREFAVFLKSGELNTYVDHLKPLDTPHRTVFVCGLGSAKPHLAVMDRSFVLSQPGGTLHFSVHSNQKLAQWVGAINKAISQGKKIGKSAIYAARQAK